MTKRITYDGSLKIGDIRPGSTVSVDHFESRLLVYTLNSYGGPSADKFVGGCIFVDHESGLVHVDHQVGFSAVETIQAKPNFEKLCFDHGLLYITIWQTMEFSSQMLW